MNNELDDTREDDIEILGQDEIEKNHECGNHELHEAAAEYLTERSDKDIHNFQPGEIDPANIEKAHELSAELDDDGLQSWLHDEVAEDLQQALDRLEQRNR